MSALSACGRDATVITQPVDAFLEGLTPGDGSGDELFRFMTAPTLSDGDALSLRRTSVLAEVASSGGAGAGRGTVSGGVGGVVIVRSKLGELETSCRSSDDRSILRM